MRYNCFVFNCTWRCNLACDYCIYRFTKPDDSGKYKMISYGKHEFEIDGELHWALWLAFLERFRPYHLEFCGGEPTMWDGFLHMTQHLSFDCSYAVTSNTLRTEVIQLLQPRNSLCWTASYHYKRFDDFRHNVDLLQRKGFRTNVTMTITPDNYKEADEMLEAVSGLGVGMTVQPAICEDFSWDDHRDILDHFKSRQGSIPFFINPIDRPLDKRLEPQSACCAGTNYFILFPDGKVYRCLGGAAYRKQEPMGHIRDFTPNAFEHPCEYGCVYSCDLDALNGKWDDADTHLRTAVR